jgi:acyl transferase domain-containing protein
MDTIRNISLIGKINSAANEVNDLIQHLSLRGGQLHAIDKDSLLLKLQQLYSLAVMLEAQSVEHHQKDFRLIIETVQTEKTDEVSHQNNAPEESPVAVEPPAQENLSRSRAVDLVVNEPEKITQKEADSLWDEESSQAAAPLKADPLTAEVKKPEAPDLFGGLHPESLADKLASHKDNSLAARLEQSKINDLRKAIGINEKFLFINDLFEGNLSYYNKAIDELNSFQSLNGARTYLIELSVEYGWPTDSSAKEKLNQLIDRKFESNA